MRRLQPKFFGFASSLFLLGLCCNSLAGESPYLYGIHDHDPAPTEFLSHITNGTHTGGWITATVAVGANTNDFSGANFSSLSNAGHTVICRINYGYYPDGTIPVASKYDDFATRCKNFVANSSGCNIWLIGNELNLAAEWPFDSSNNRFNYVSPQSYADCFRKCYDAIKSIRPNDKILPQPTAPWGGPYGAGFQNIGGTNYPHDAQPLSWVQYESQMLAAITNSGGLDGIALHIGSRGYHYSDIHSTNKFGGVDLYASFYVYKDWVDYGIPQALYHLPLYATECNGLYYWKGGGPPGEDPSQHYEPGWVQEIFAEINRYNQAAAGSGKPIYRCINFYRWCGFCDGWNIDGASNTNKAQILSDLDAAVAQLYAWPTNYAPTNVPPAPTNLTASVGNGNVTLSWDAALTASSYKLKRATVNGGPYAVIASNLTTTSYVNTSFTPNTTYYYVVSALNAVGESTNSIQVSATPTNGLPDVVVTAVSWINPAIYAGTNVIFRATVQNQGSASTPAGVTLGIGFLVDGVQYCYSGSHSAALAPGASITLNSDGPAGANFWPATTGPHTVTANVDDIDRFPEGNENNNVRDTNLTVNVLGYAINTGGSASGAFIADNFWSGSASTFSVTNVINTAAVTNPAPQTVYQTERWNDFTYTLPYVAPGNYTVRLHFAEISPSVTATNDRRFHVSINGTQVLTNFDIFAAAGGKFRGVTREFNATPDSNGRIIIDFTRGASNEAKCSGVEVFTAPPRFLSANRIASNIVMKWETFPGKSYRVQYKTNLNQINWLTLGADTLATTNTLSATNGIIGNAQRYFRIFNVN